MQPCKRDDQCFLEQQGFFSSRTFKTLRAADFEGKKKSTFTENHLITAEMVKGTTTITYNNHG
jgi:hypothetical protein